MASRERGERWGGGALNLRMVGGFGQGYPRLWTSRWREKRGMAGNTGTTDSPGLSPYEHSLVWKLLLKLRPTEEQYETLRFRCEGGWETGSAAGPLP